MQLTHKVALITGAGSGIGKASAIAFAKAGASVPRCWATPAIDAASHITGTPV